MFNKTHQFYDIYAVRIWHDKFIGEKECLCLYIKTGVKRGEKERERGNIDKGYYKC